MYYLPEKAVHEVLKAIKNNDGFPGFIEERLRKYILGKFATVEISPHTGMDIQWTLTAEGKKELRKLNGLARWHKKHKDWKNPRAHYTPDAVVYLTIEVLDALKSIRETGHPNTDKLDVLARIQRRGTHAAKTREKDGQYITVSGSLAECKDGVWTLTDAGKRVEAGHIRKTECAQFSGKVR